MARPLPSRTERLVRAVMLLVTSSLLTLIAWSLGLYKNPDSTQVAIIIFAIVMRLFGWTS